MSRSELSPLAPIFHPAQPPQPPEASQVPEVAQQPEICQQPKTCEEPNLSQPSEASKHQPSQPAESSQPSESSKESKTPIVSTPSFHLNPGPPREATRLPKRNCRKFLITFPYATRGINKNCRALVKVSWDKGERVYGPYDRVEELLQNDRRRFHFLISNIKFPHAGEYSYHIRVFDLKTRGGARYVHSRNLSFDNVAAMCDEMCPYKTVVHEDGLGIHPGYDLDPKTSERLDHMSDLAWVQRKEKEKREEEEGERRRRERRDSGSNSSRGGRARGFGRGGRTGDGGHRSRGSVSSVWFNISVESAK
ncbi:hypothetical protein QBC44DRAFT_386492 [Cladorrhinum sp. PSN332]|nr:hypothetical protein QBC44DRAFT_386492 [Cladorrhinum sp. PSN332]